MSEVGLVEPARQRLVTIAADVLGRLTADEVPPALKAIARFTPAKRVSLGAASLAAALDADEAFRERVADVVADAGPDLAEAVRTGGPVTASDPLDVALVAYLLRPDGWEDAVAAANERWAAEQRATAGQGVQQREAARAVRAEAAELRARLKDEAARAREAVAAATAEAAAELAEARRELRSARGDIRAARAERDKALAELTELRKGAEQDAAQRDAELRRLRARVAELERAGEVARRDVRVERDLDESRLWLLVDTVTEAAAGLRRELSLAPPAMLPADAVGAVLGDGASSDGAQARRIGDRTALDRVLALPHVHLVVDGYNVTKAGYPSLSLEQQRSRLTGALAAFVARSSAETTVVFDGATRLPAQPPAPRGVRVLFSAPGEIADDVIRRLVAAEPAGRPVVVVTSDQQVVRDVLGTGAWTAASATLLELLG